MNPETTGSIVEIIRNDDDLYDGDLIPYFRAVFFHAQNLRHPYHNLRHMLHVLWLCYQACIFYASIDAAKGHKGKGRRGIRSLLIAAIFHDFDHSGQFGNDDLNIERAIRGLRKHIVDMDRDALSHIESLIRATEYPYTVAVAELTPFGQVLRDADASQSLSVAWLQQVVVGLAAEWGKTPLEVLKIQSPFHRKLVFHSEWAKQQFPAEVIAKKIAEAEALLSLLELTPSIS